MQEGVIMSTKKKGQVKADRHKKDKPKAKSTPVKAARHNTGKPKLSFTLLGSIAGEAAVWEFGARKYARGNWLNGVAYTEAADSLLRHIHEFLSREDMDVESGLPHVDHIVCCAKILSHSYHRRKDLDDRGG